MVAFLGVLGFLGMLGSPGIKKFLLDFFGGWSIMQL